MKTNIDGMICKKIFFRKKRYNTVKKTAYGDNLTLKTVEDPLSIKMYGKSVQETVPGNQLLNLPDMEFTQNGITMICKNNIVTVSGITTELINSSLRGIEYFLPIVPGTYYISGNYFYAAIKNQDGNFSYANNKTFTLDGTEKSVTLYFNINKGVTVNETIYPMLNKGSTALPWEPYTGGITIPSHDNPSEIKSVVVSEVKVCGKNLLDTTCYTNSANYNPLVIFDDASVIKKGNTYTVSVTLYAPSSTKAYWNDSCGFIVSKSFVVDAGTNRYSYTFTANSDGGPKISGKNVMLSKSATGDGIEITATDFQIEEGDTATAYSPYTENIATLSQPITLHGIGDVMDELAADRVVRKFKKLKMSADLPWEYKKTNTYGNHNFQIRLERNGFPKGSISNAHIAAVKFTHFMYMDDLWDTEGLKRAKAYVYSDEVTISFPPDSKINSLESWKQFLTDNENYVQYIIAEPITEPLPEADQIALRSLHSYDGVTHVMCDAEMEVEYVESASGDPYVLYKKMYIDGKLVYSAGNPVTYVVDSGIQYTEEVDFDASCLSPKTFTPTLDGWDFVGWRDDESASGDVLSSKVMGDSPITLYAVYSKTVTLSYNGNGSTGGSVSSHSGKAYRNYTGYVVGASFNLKANGYTRTYYNFNGWSVGAVGATVTLSDSTTAYAQWVVNPSSVPVSNFGYNGGVQTYTVPVTGLYKLEVWGGRPEAFSMYDYETRYGGAGGYSVGYKELTAGTVLYIACGGGNGKTYNGGGALTHADIRNGAGATHIALVNGTLAEIGYDQFVTNKKGLIVAGGGGSGSMYGDWSYEGGSGGGLSGGSVSWYGEHSGGTQTNGYAFGQGGPGAGGGLYGGHGGSSCAGGSGYIDGVPAITYKGTTYAPQTTNGVNSGDGRSTITLVA